MVFQRGLALTAVLVSVSAANPFATGSDVITLNPSNWKQLEKSPLVWFVNVCREGCGYCSLLQPHWQKLAAKLKHQVQVAYWDTETRQQPPAALGEIKGTPTIKLFYPQKKSKKNKKVSVDYNGPRELKPMVKFATEHMPNFVEKVEGESGHAKFTEKAESNGLPQVLLFSKSKGTKPLIKALSSVFRRRLLIGEIRSTKPNKALIEKFGVSEYPTLMLIGEEGSDPTVFEKKPTFNRLKNFLDSHALKKPVSKKDKEKRKRAAEAEAEAETKGEL